MTCGAASGVEASLYEPRALSEPMSYAADHYAADLQNQRRVLRPGNLPASPTCRPLDAPTLSSKSFVASSLDVQNWIPVVSRFASRRLNPSSRRLAGRLRHSPATISALNNTTSQNETSWGGFVGSQ